MALSILAAPFFIEYSLSKEQFLGSIA